MHVRMYVYFVHVCLYDDIQYTCKLCVHLMLHSLHSFDM